MKPLSFVLLICAFVAVIQSQTPQAPDGCVWRYKCCEFKTIGGAVTCDRMCEPEEDCSTTEVPTEVPDKIEAAEEEYFVKPAVFSLSANAPHICRQGFRLNNRGQCKRVLGSPTESTTTETPETK